MKKTDMLVCCGMTSTQGVYRTVYENDGHYFVKWKGELINVDKDIENRSFTRKNIWV